MKNVVEFTKFKDEIQSINLGHFCAKANVNNFNLLIISNFETFV